MDWKSGQLVTRAMKSNQLFRFATQMCLYRCAWAACVGVNLADVGTMVTFLAGFSHYTLEELAVFLGASGALSLDDALRDALGREG